MEAWIVIKELYGRGMTNDFGQPVSHTSEIVGIFSDELDAERFRDDMVNESEYEILPTESDAELDPEEIYIDGIVEGGFEIKGNVLLEVLESYKRMIERNNGKYPAVVLDDIYHSIKAVLKANWRGDENEKMR